MRASLLTFFLTLSILSFGQTTPFLEKTQLNRWSISTGLGSVHFFGDVKEYDWYPAKSASFSELRFGAHVSATKMMNSLYGVQLSMNRGGLAGIRTKGGECKGCNTGHDPLIDSLSSKFEGDFWSGDVSLIFNLSNLSTKIKNPFDRKWMFYGEAGLGILAYRSLLTTLNNDVLLSSRGYNDFPGVDINVIKKKERVVESLLKLALSTKYKLNKKIDLKASANFYKANTDLLDATKISGKDVLGANDDKYVYLSVGLSYQLGSKKQSIEWYNPNDKMYHSQKKTHRQIEGLTKDSDGDGVADQFDNEPDTPDGISVDGSGKPLDVDMDGVADYQDSDPFSNIGAIVDETGKELDDDKDGIPNSKDLEPNTDSGAIVSYQGVTIKGNGGVSSSFLPSVYFSSGSNQLRKEDIKSLATVAKTLRNNPKLVLVVIGHADSYGDVYSNQQLALERAENIIDHLVEVYGIESNRLRADSKGETQPLALTPAIQVEIEGRGITIDDYLSEVNRRVDFEIAE